MTRDPNTFPEIASNRVDRTQSPRTLAILGTDKSVAHADVFLEKRFIELRHQFPWYRLD